MFDPTVIATATAVIVAGFGLIYGFIVAVEMIVGYSQGRKRGGYPVLAKLRRTLFNTEFKDSAYIAGMKKAQKKLEGGGYK